MPRVASSGIITEEDARLWTDYVSRDVPTRRIKAKIARMKIYQRDQVAMAQRLESQVRDMEKEIKAIYSQITKIKSRLPAVDLQIQAEKTQLSMRKKQLYPVFIAHLYRTNYLRVQMSEDGLDESEIFGMEEENEIDISELPDDL